MTKANKLEAKNCKLDGVGSIVFNVDRTTHRQKSISSIYVGSNSKASIMLKFMLNLVEIEVPPVFSKDLTIKNVYSGK